MTDQTFDGFSGYDPEYGLDQVMDICATTGEWSGGSLYGSLTPTAAYLEYLRRGGGTTEDATHTRTWLAERATIDQLDRLQDLGAHLQRYTETRDWSGLGDYLDAQMWLPASQWKQFQA